MGGLSHVTHVAVAAGAGVAHGYAVTCLELANTAAHFANRTNQFMPGLGPSSFHDAVQGAPVEVQIGAANGGGANFHQYLVGVFQACVVHLRRFNIFRPKVDSCFHKIPHQN